MSSITVQQDPESYVWAVREPSNGVHWTFISEADAREAAGALEALVSAHVMVPLHGVELQEQAGASEQ